MATMSKFPPDVPKDWDEASDEIENATTGLRAKAADMADKATETVKDGYSRAKDAIVEMDPVETAREGGEAAMRAVERHPVIAFGLGALSVGLIAWSALRTPPATSWERYEPEFNRLRRLFGDYGNEAAKSSDSALKTGQQWLSSYGGDARDYAEHGSRLIANRAQKEPIAALLGVGIAVYVIGSLLTSSSEAAPARRRAPAKR
ncbi:hypothetical protein [Bosea sp. PAMC 26642]|uniref:hypothetical protein n=1 Tax=Bosea sp. (strain PAMC 26642) TaxID=1792307 RepID=UPI00077057F0|nr:hypothetical protein [Bosea sp. PAMC 26642]AMJ61932.1 hypothetical protein AXW83_17965 [Bosea sp. PAMC 26642]